MTNIDISFLKSHVDKSPVTINFIDGEEVIASIVSVSDRENDLIYKIISTNKKHKYPDLDRIYLARLNQVKSVS